MMSDEKQSSEQTRFAFSWSRRSERPLRMVPDSRQRLVAASVAVVACLLAFALISGDETAPATTVAPQKTPCKLIDGRSPLARMLRPVMHGLT